MALEPQSFRVNRDLFSNYYLDEHLPETEEWDQVGEEALEEARQEILELWNQERDTVEKTNESQLERRFIRPMFDKLGIPFEVEESVSRTQRRPDYGFFGTEEAARNAFDRREEGGDFYDNAVAVADAKRWDRPLDTRGSGEHQRDFENPSYQIHVYLQETPVRWAVLTNGRKWRLYYGPTSHRLDSYFEIDLPTILEEGDLADFKYFYLFFRHEAFIEDTSGDAFLDDVYDESNVFARELGEDLQDNIYKAIKVLSEGFLQFPDNDLTEDDLKLIHDSSLIYLYRLIFVLYAEAEGRDLLDTDNEIYEESYSLNALKQEIAEELDSTDSKYRDWQTNLWSRLDELFRLIDQGSKSRGIPEDDLHIPAYNGGLFRTNPDEDDSAEAPRFLDEHGVGDAYLADVIDLLARSRNGSSGGKIFVDYSSLNVRHLGSIYEGLLEYQLNVADEPLALDDGEYVAAEKGDAVVVDTGDIYLTTDSGERKATGSYYTPEYVVEYIVENTLGPLVDDIRNDLAGQDASDDGGFAAEFADRVFGLKVLDPAMGSGHFLTSAVDYLAREIIDAQEKQAAQEGIETVDKEHDINWARRQVAQRCIYGVDLNPLAVELAKVSLWLRTLAAEQPLAFLDHHLKTGNSLIGSDIETVLDNGDPGNETEEGQLTLQESFDRTRQQALEQVTDQFEDLLAIDNETLADIKEMEAVYEEVRGDPLYQHLIAMANIHTAEQFGLDVPPDAYERMAEALRDDSWESIGGQDWYQSAQAMAQDQRFFHWELEFPIAFYEQNGERMEDGGFDAVIGNPPYVRIYRDKLPSELVDYLKQKYETAYMKFDLYVVFSELGIELTTDGGYFSYIIPDKFTSTPYGEPLRNLILEQTVIKSFLDLSDRKVFDDATVSNLIPVLKKSDSSTSQIDVRKFSHDNQVISTFKPIEALITKGASKFRLSRSLDDVNLMSKVEEQSIAFNDIFYVNWGLRTGTVEKTNKYVVENDDHPDAKPMIRGGDIIDSYHLKPPSEYVIYNKDDFYNPMFEELFENPKIVFRKISGRGLMAVAEEENYYCFSTLIPCVNIQNVTHVERSGIPEPTIESEHYDDVYYPLALVNSRLLEWYYSANLSDELSVVPDHIKDLPIAEISDISKSRNNDSYHEISNKINEFVEEGVNNEIVDRCAEEIDAGNESVVHDAISDLARMITKYYQRYEQLNTSFDEYLGTYSETEKLSDIGLCQPANTQRDDILRETTKEKDGLQSNDARVNRLTDNSVEIQLRARYKPENQNSNELDQWGYTKTDYIPAIQILDISEIQADLIEAFVPMVIEKGEGYANYRGNATKTISLIDRLMDIRLPNPRDVETGLNNYLEVRDERVKLDQYITRADDLVNLLIYELYHLNQEEIEIIESTVSD